jgi:hypothetical protein
MGVCETHHPIASLSIYLTLETLRRALEVKVKQSSHKVGWGRDRLEVFYIFTISSEVVSARALISLFA